jgi:hypothetical protein
LEKQETSPSKVGSGDPLDTLIRKKVLRSAKDRQRLGTLINSDDRWAIWEFININGATSWIEIKRSLEPSDGTLKNTLDDLRLLEVTVDDPHPEWIAKKGRGSPHTIFYVKGTDPEFVKDARVRLNQLMKGVKNPGAFNTATLLNAVQGVTHRGEVRKLDAFEALKRIGVPSTEVNAVLKSIQHGLKEREINVVY